MFDSDTDTAGDSQRTITPRPGVTVFQNDLGEVVVRQVWPEDVHVPEEFADFRFVRIPPEAARQVAKWILEVVSEIDGQGQTTPS